MRDFDGDVSKLAMHRMKPEGVAVPLEKCPAFAAVGGEMVLPRMYPDDGGLKEQVRSFDETPNVLKQIVQEVMQKALTRLLGRELWRLCDGEFPFMLAPQPHRLVIIESPFGHPTKVGMEENAAYGRRCLLDSINRGESPYASHLLLTQCLDDAKVAERKQGMEAGFAWGRVAQHVAVYTDRGISKGMLEGIKRHQAAGKTIEFRSITNVA